MITHDKVSRSRMCRFLSIVIEIEPFIHLTKSLEYLSNYSPKICNTLEPICRRLSNNETDEEREKRLMLRELPFFGHSAIEHLMFTVWKFGGPNGKAVVEEIEPRFNQLYGNFWIV